jgi:hypothetical protein
MLRAIRGWLPSAQLVAVAAVISVVGAIVSIAVYGSGSFIPGLFGNFAASLGAFMLALAWERDRERRQLDQAARELEQRRVTEVRRRFASVKVELEKNAESLAFLSRAVTKATKESPLFQAVHPQLLEGAWSANAPHLSELVADYELIAKLATTYGRIEELRWRIRYRTDHVTTILDEMTEPLINELREEVADLVERVRAQVDEPSVQPLGLQHTASFAASITGTGTLTTTVIRGDRDESA